MRKGHVLRYIGGMLSLVALVIGFFALPVHAQTSSSNNYQATELQFGSASGEESCSASYCSTVTMGDLGNSSSAASAAFGGVGYTEPVIEMIIDAGQSNLGVLTTEKEATKTTIVRVRNYQTGGYHLQVLGKSPSYNGRSLATLASPTTSRPGTEQFGINLVKNTLPEVGEMVVQVPLTEGQRPGDIFGEVDAAYATPNLYAYNEGDTIARSAANSGGADYTISIVVNISSGTPAGHYAGDFSVLLVPAF